MSVSLGMTQIVCDRHTALLPVMEVLLLGSESESRGRKHLHTGRHIHNGTRYTETKCRVKRFFQRLSGVRPGLKMSESDAELTSKLFHREGMKNTCTFRAQGGLVVNRDLQ